VWMDDIFYYLISFSAVDVWMDEWYFYCLFS
jgi:hypothetical protein